MGNGNKFSLLIKRISLRFLVLAVSAQIIISFFGAAYCAIKLLSSKDDINLNPVLNEYTDITPEIVNGIASNKFKSITISYEFTRCRNPDESAEEYQHYRNKYNPFVMANNISPLKEFSAQIIFSDNVTSLDCAFTGLEQVKLSNSNRTPPLKK